MTCNPGFVRVDSAEVVRCVTGDPNTYDPAEPAGCKGRYFRGSERFKGSRVLNVDFHFRHLLPPLGRLQSPIIGGVTPQFRHLFF